VQRGHGSRFSWVRVQPCEFDDCTRGVLGLVRAEYPHRRHAGIPIERDNLRARESRLGNRREGRRTLDRDLLLVPIDSGRSKFRRDDIGARGWSERVTRRTPGDGRGRVGQPDKPDQA